MKHIEHIQKDEIYSIQFDGLSGPWLAKVSNWPKFHGGIFCSTHPYYSDSGEFSLKLSCPPEVIAATPEQKRWVETCIKANRFIPLSDIPKEPVINNQYELY